MKTIFLFISNFVFSSDLLRTEYIKYLSKKYRVIVLSPIFGANSSGHYYQSPNVEYINWDAESPNFWLFWTKTLRLSLIREFDGLEYFKLRRLTKANLNWQRKLLRAVSFLIPRRFLTADFFTKLEMRFLPKSKTLNQHLEKYKPELLLTCTPGFSSIDAEAIIFAKRNHLRTAAINSSWDNYTSNATQLRKTDYLICWNQAMKKEALAIHHYPDEKVFVSGIYRFDHHFRSADSVTKKDFLLSKNLDPVKKTVFFSTVPQNTYPFQASVLKEILAMREKLAGKDQFNILVRLHPNDIAENYAEFQNINNLHMELSGKAIPSKTKKGYTMEMDEADLANLRYSIKYTDININFRSSISLEATIYDKPIINIALYDYANRYQMDHYIPILQTGGVKLVKTAEELQKSIIAYLKNPALDSDGRKKIFNEYIGLPDGKSSERSVDALAKMV